VQCQVGRRLRIFGHVEKVVPAASGQPPSSVSAPSVKELTRPSGSRPIALFPSIGKPSRVMAPRVSRTAQISPELVSAIRVFGGTSIPIGSRSGPLFRPNANSRGNSSTRGDPKDFGLPRPPFEGPADRTCCAGRRRQARILLSTWHIQACRTGKLCANSTPVGINDVKWLLPPPARRPPRPSCTTRQPESSLQRAR